MIIPLKPRKMILDFILGMKIASRKLLRVVTEDDMLITTYMTDKIKKYMEEGD